TRRSEVSQVRNSEIPRAASNYSGESANSTANAANTAVAVNTTSPASGAANAASNSSVVAVSPIGSPPGDTVNRLDSATSSGSNSNTAPERNDKDYKSEAKPMAAAPKVPAAADQPVVSEREKKEVASDVVTAGKDDALAK